MSDDEVQAAIRVLQRHGVDWLGPFIEEQHEIAREMNRVAEEQSIVGKICTQAEASGMRSVLFSLREFVTGEPVPSLGRLGRAATDQ